MKISIKIVLLLVLFNLILLVGCTSPVTKEIQSSDGDTTVRKEKQIEIEDVHLRDKKLLYTKDDVTNIVTMYLTVSSGNAAEGTNHTWEEINTYSVYYYDERGIDRYKVEGLLQIGDENGPVAGELGYGQRSPNCIIQIRGQTSSKNAQKNYKVKLKENKGEWNGQTTIALNKHQTDGLRFRNKMAYDLLSGIDELISLRTSFVHLYVKDTTSGKDKFEDYGLYTQVEQLNKTALKTHGLDKNGQLYKVEFCEFYRYEDKIKLKTDPTYSLTDFEDILEVKGSDDHQKLIDMLDMVNNYSIPIDVVINKYFDVENLTYWLAFHILVGNVDTQGRNCYLYSPLNSEKWYLITWDNDAMLKQTENEIHTYSDQSGWENGINNYWGIILFQRCFKLKEFRIALDEAVENLKRYLSEDRLNEYAKTYSKTIKEYIYQMPDRMHAPLTEKQYDYVVSKISDNVEKNYNLYKKSYQNPMPFYIGVPEKKGKKYTLVWDTAYDFNGEKITYTFELATDYKFKNVIVKKKNIKIPLVEIDILPEGQYFIRIKAKNESGFTQHAFDYYVTSEGKVYGTKCFYVDKKGRIVEDVYVEG